MHELSIALSLIDAVCDEIPRLGGATVRSVRVRVGALSGVSADALLFAFDVAAEGSPLAGAEMCIERTAGRELEVTALEVFDDSADC